MNQNHITDELINAFIDDQLATDERMQVLDALKQEQNMSRIVCEMQHNDEILQLTHNNTPEPVYNPYAAATRTGNRQRAAVAASLLFIISMLAGWQLHQFYMPFSEPQIQEIGQLDTEHLVSKKILMHISVMDATKIDNALDKAELLLNNSKNKDIQVEIIANADGLGLLRENSPYRERIKSLSHQHKNVSFKACGIAMKTASLKEGNEIQLLPEAKRVPAALDQILNRLKAGWLYIKT